MKAEHMKGACMKAASFAVLFLVLQSAAFPSWAGTIKEADYPTQYEVVSGNKSEKLKIEKSCTMTLKDHAKPNIAINVSKSGYGSSCHMLETGKVYRGRQNDKKNEIELVITVGNDKARVETWHLDGTVDINPSANPN
jgi:hypothetical protein